MKQLKEYTNSKNLVPSIDILLKRIEKLPLPYTGNKKKLVYHLHKAIIKNNIEFNTVLDAFSGSATVSYMFKLMGKRVISNELLTSSYLNAVALVENPGVKLTEDEKEFLLYNQNPNKGTFVEDNYLGEGDNKSRFRKFTLKECRHLDNFRANIDELCGIHSQGIGLAANAAVIMRLPFGNADQSLDILKHRKKQQVTYGKCSDKHDRRIGIYYDDDLNLKFDKWFKKYVTDFTKGIQTPIYDKKIKRAAFLTNLQQHVLRDCMVQGRLNQGQALAEVDIRLKHQKNQLKGHWSNNGSTEMDFFTKSGTDWEDCKPGQGMRWWSFADLDLPGSCIATNTDVTGLLKSGFCDVDCVYFDPPYGGQSSDYATIYRFLEEYVYNVPLEELPHIQENAYKFVKKACYETHFREMLVAAKHIPIWIFSYNDRSWRSIDDIVDLIREYKDNVIVEILNENYRYLYRKQQGRSDKSVEYLIIGR